MPVLVFFVWAGHPSGNHELWLDGGADQYPTLMAARDDFPDGPAGDALWNKLTAGFPTREASNG